MKAKKIDSRNTPTITKPPGRARSAMSAVEPREAYDDNRSSLYVRISKDARTILKDVAVGTITNARVIEALLEHFQKQHQDDKEKILGGRLINPRQEFEDLIAKLHKAQHAFENNRYFLAVKDYRGILEGLNSSEELKDVCNYRLGLCWIRLSYELRKEALKNDSDYERYNLASDAIDKAADYLRKLKDSSDLLTKLIKHYNLACCHSLKAQYMVESRLDPKSDLIAGLRNALNAPPSEPNKREEAWKRVGKAWRTIYKGRNVDAEAHGALNELQEIYLEPSSESKSGYGTSPEASELSSEAIWLVESAWEDEDFVFLRSDTQKWHPKFKRWRESALNGEKSIADAIRILLFEQ